MKHLISTVIVSSVLLGSGVAVAQSDEVRADARAAAGEGAAAFRDGKYAQAIDFFERAESMVHAPPHLLFIARSYTQLGKLVKAREVYRKIAREQLAPGAPPAFEHAQQAAQAELPDVDARIPTIKITVEGADPTAVVATMDGAALPAALFGIPRPVDPGAHKFRAIGEGLDSGEQMLTLADRAKESLVLTLKPAPGVHLPTATPLPAPAETTSPASASAAAPRDTELTEPSTASGTSPLRIASYAAFGVGAVGLGLGTVFALSSHSTRKEVDGLCSDGTCPESDRQKIEDDVTKANGQGRLATIFLVTGGAGLAAGATLFVLSGKKHGAEQANGNLENIRAFVGPSSVGVSGRF